MKFRIIMLALSIAACSSNVPQQKTVRVFFLAGQSNMDGVAKVEELPAGLNKTFEDVWIFHGNPAADDETGGGVGQWSLLRPGHGSGFTTDGQRNSLSGNFGPEMAFAHRLQEIYPGETIALVKYSRGGSSIDSAAAAFYGCWEPNFQGKTGINQFDHFVTTVNNAMANKDSIDAGQAVELLPSGIIWVQGESDAAYTVEIAQNYQNNLTKLMTAMREVIGDPQLPVVIAKIGESNNGPDGKAWKHSEIVQAEQEAFVADDSHAEIVCSADDITWNDPWHYDGPGYIKLGRECADAAAKLLQGER